MAESLLERRRIEAEFAKGIFEILAEETSKERAAEILSKAIIRLAIRAGETFAAQLKREPEAAKSGTDPAGSPADLDLLAYADILALWQQDGALAIDLKVKEKNRLEFDVTRCRYAEMYRQLGIPELGRLLSCNRDGAFCQGFNPAIRLTREKTIMDGADHCDFRFALNQTLER